VTGENRFGVVKKLLEKRGYIVFTPDLPGFGSNQLQKESLIFEDYISFVKEFLDKNKLRKVVLVGHSFGGRIAIRFSSANPDKIKKLILVSASGIPHPLPSIKKKIAFVLTKIFSPLFTIPPFSLFYSTLRKLVYYSIGEMDYYKANKLRTTFKNIYQVSIVTDLEKISAPTLIVWAELDNLTPLRDGRLMHSKIKKSKLVIEKGATHKFPYEQPEIFVKEILTFIQ